MENQVGVSNPIASRVRGFRAKTHVMLHYLVETSPTTIITFQKKNRRMIRKMILELCLAISISSLFQNLPTPSNLRGF